jgi:hypothetical protein
LELPCEMRKLAIWSVAIICLADLSSCAMTSFAPPVTAEWSVKNSHIALATLREGRALFVHRCIECHTLPAYWHYRIEDWPKIVDSMSDRANLKPSEREAIVAYILALRSQ